MSTNADLQRRAEKIFLELIDLDSRERTIQFNRLCGDDSALRVEVESLLAQYDGPDGLLDRAALNIGPAVRRASEMDQLPPKPCAGGYTLLGVVGQGGMGVVYRARQERTKRIVAVKLIRRALLTSAMHRRFEAEATMLARLHHPCIGQIFEADVADFGHGVQPFIAMELIHGRPLIEFASAHDLNTKSRMRLMADVCDAVQHAHHRGVIHRDLKPANILVVEKPPVDQDATGSAIDGQPKILDFGVARATDDDVRLTSMRTSAGQIIGTLAYMSPEQVKAAPDEIDTRSDVYALGIILYELLAGRLPLDVSSRSIPEAARRILEDRPTRLSAISRTFRGDIDTIVSKAIEKDPSQRYQSAAEFAADIRRYLSDEPVVARRASAFYTFKKFASRHKRFVGVTTVVALLLLASAVVSMIFAIQAKIAQGLAEEATGLAERRRLLAESEASNAQRSAYLANLAAAETALAMQDVATAQSRLRAVDSAHRQTWEWKHFNSQLDKSYAVLKSPTNGSRTLSLSPDSRLLAVAEFDGKVRIWDLNSRSIIHTLGAAKDDFSHVVFSPDGRSLACAGKDGDLRVFDAASFDLKFATRAHDTFVSEAAFSHDGSLVLTASPDKTVKVWNAHTGEAVGTPIVHESAVFVAAFSPDQTMIATGGEDKIVRIWRWPLLGEPLLLSGHRGNITDLCFSPDGSRLATGSLDRTIRVWDVADGRELRTLRNHRDQIAEVMYSPDGQWILSASEDATLRFWDAESGVQTAVAHGHTGPISSAAWSPDGRLIASCARYDSIRLWDASIATGIDVLYGHTKAAFCVAFSPDGTRIATGSGDHTARLWDADSATEIAVLRAHEREI
ncbi:MAG: protein kinase, partial [Phycisphaerales bacterium]|nr:protein kinase [Phycisphaerales bacterium]